MHEDFSDLGPPRLNDFNQVFLTERLTLLHLVRVPIVWKNYNDGQSRTWHPSAKSRNEIEYTLSACGHRMEQPFDEPVVLRITRVLGYKQSKWDSDSGLRGNAKQLIDSLVACGWFHDDSCKYITETRFTQFEPTVREALSTTIIEVFRAEQIFS